MSDQNTERPLIIKRCKRCDVTQNDIDGGYVIVSPTGTAHISNGWEGTACGRNATGDDWWWPPTPEGGET